MDVYRNARFAGVNARLRHHETGGQFPTSFICRINSVVRFASTLSLGLNPPLKALCRVVDLPSGMVGPVDCAHGFHVRISAACRARRSGVQPFAIVGLQ